MAAELKKLNGTLQENIISLLAHNDIIGKIIAAAVSPQLFEGEYRTIAERCIDYWARHGKAPKAHMPDLVDDILSDKANRKGKTYTRILNSMLDLVEHINVNYVLEQLHTFTRMQRLKDAILKSAEQLNSQQEVAVAEVEKIWSDLLKTRETNYQVGTKLGDFKKLIEYLETQYAEFVTGIKPLDDATVVPSRGAVVLFLAAAKRGKSWFLINCGVRALMLRKKVLHISLEMSEEQVLQRYYQALFAITKYEELITNRTIQRDDDGFLRGLGEKEVEPDFTFNSIDLDSELRVHIGSLGTRADYLRIKRFPPRSVDMDDIRAYIQNLEVVEGFIPDEIILDYIGIAKADPKNPRIAMGRNLEEFRAINIERNTAGVTAGQLSKEGADAMTAGATNVAEDWSMIGTADIVLVFSSTDAEKALGLGRLRVTNARDQEDNFSVLLTQNYRSGQFVLDSIRLSPDYYEMLNELKIENNLEDQPDAEEEDDE
jgi:hypothetical protein